jgi:hypothetical protein
MGRNAYTKMYRCLYCNLKKPSEITRHEYDLSDGIH